MQVPTQSDLKESIEELSDYRDRLKKEVINVAQKLRMPKTKLEDALTNNFELKKIEEIISQLTKQLEAGEEDAEL